MNQNVDFFGFDQIQTPQYPDIHSLSEENPFEAYTNANDANLNDLQFKFDNFQKNQLDFQMSFQKKQDDLLNQMRNFMQNFHNGPSIPPPEKEDPPQDSDIRQLIRKECCIEVAEEEKQKMEDTILDLFEICRQKELLCIHDNVDDLIESALNTKLLSINSNFQSFDKKEQEVKNDILPISSECEVTSEDKRECDVLVCENSSTIDVCDNHSEILSDFDNDDDISSDDKSFEDIEYVDASLPDPEIVSVEEENDVHQEEEEVNLEEVQDVVPREKLVSINRLIANIESLNDNLTPDCVLTSFASIPILEESDYSLSLPEFETFCNHTEETRSGSTITHADNSLPEYDSFRFEI
nr:hypothetical protein [Tanacetum cinerariifolium]